MVDSTLLPPVRAVAARLDKPAEQLNVQARGGGCSRPPLNGEAIPACAFGLDGLNDAIEGFRALAKSLGSFAAAGASVW
jgi:hypothetical protein